MLKAPPIRGMGYTHKSRLVLLKHRNKRAWVYPEQGFQLYGFEQDFGKTTAASVIYAPDRNREPPERRYGNPILFPNPGFSQSDHGLNTWIWQEKALSIPLHGFARDTCWQLLDLHADRVTAEMLPNPSAALAFPFKFRLELTYRLEERGLVLDAMLENIGKESFPYAFGFHPYLNAPLGRKGSVKNCFVKLPAGIRNESTHQWKNPRKSSFAAQRIRGDHPLEPAILLRETYTRDLEVEDEANGFVARISTADSCQSLDTWVIWSESPEAPFLCLEPWTDIPNALNRPETRCCAVGEEHRYQMILSVGTL